MTCFLGTLTNQNSMTLVMCGIDCEGDHIDAAANLRILGD